MGRRREGGWWLTFSVIAVVGCGGGAASSGPPSVGQDFAAKALAACASALDAKRAQGAFPVQDFNPTHPAPSALPVVADFLQRTDATFRGWSAAMHALGTPPGGAQAWSQLVDAIDRHVQLNADQIDAARSGDAVRFAADYDAGVATQAALLAAATAAGIADCAKVDR